LSPGKRKAITPLFARNFIEKLDIREAAGTGALALGKKSRSKKGGPPQRWQSSLKGRAPRMNEIKPRHLANGEPLIQTGGGRGGKKFQIREKGSKVCNWSIDRLMNEGVSREETQNKRNEWEGIIPDKEVRLRKQHSAGATSSFPSPTRLGGSSYANYPSVPCSKGE